MTSTPVLLPKLAETTDVFVVESWQVAVGDQVQAGQTLLTVESDKTTVDVPSPVSGTVVELSVDADDEINTGYRICVIDDGVASTP